MNDGIEPEVCSLRYTSVDEACRRVVAKGHGTVLAKFDVQGEFRTALVHPGDRWLLGMSWEGRNYVDKVLPFGLRLALSYTMPWLMHCCGSWGTWMELRVLENFLLFGYTNSISVNVPYSWCWFAVMPWVCRWLPGSKHNPDLELLDTLSMTVCLPPMKLE